MRSGIERILTDWRASGGTAFYKIYMIFQEEPEVPQSGRLVEISGFSHFFGFEDPA